MKIKKIKKDKILKGNIKVHADGFGFVIPDDKNHPDIYIPPEALKSALTDDYVEVRVQNRRGGVKRYFGQVQSILKRGIQFAVGPYEIRNDQPSIQHHNINYNKSILVENPKQIPIQKKDWIKVKIVQYPTTSRQPLKGEVMENLGQIDSSCQSDAKRVLAENNISSSFSEEVLQELQDLPDEVQDKDLKNRTDLRQKNFVTIDGDTARDYDDAILVEQHDFGYRLFVAIADVSHYVKINSKLDQEAFERSNSTYFPDFCIPMLPEKLSNNICSLNPLQNRLVLLAEIDFNFQGEVINSKMHLGAIKSKHRLTYERVQNFIDNQFKPQSLNFLEPAVHLAKILIKNHYKQGALDLEVLETNILLNKKGEPLKVVSEQRLFAHQMIEQFMLQANQVASAFLEKHNQNLIYRIHEKPKEDRIKNLNIFAQKLGYSHSIQTRKNMTNLLSQFKSHSKKDLLNKLVLRSLSQARYSPHNKQHYGLNFESYTHFTSPIRRYCDLMIHRFIKSILLEHDKIPVSLKDLESMATHISEKEQKSVKAERQFMDIKKLGFFIVIWVRLIKELFLL